MITFAKETKSGMKEEINEDLTALNNELSKIKLLNNVAAKELLQGRKIQVMALAIAESINHWAADWDVESVKTEDLVRAVVLMVSPAAKKLPLAFAWFAADWAMTEIMASGSIEKALAKAEELSKCSETDVHNFIEEHIGTMI